MPLGGVLGLSNGSGETQPKETEDRVFRLWGLKHAGASPHDLDAAVADLLKTQRPDGGWSQLIEPADSTKTNGGKGPAS